MIPPSSPLIIAVLDIFLRFLKSRMECLMKLTVTDWPWPISLRRINLGRQPVLYDFKKNAYET